MSKKYISLFVLGVVVVLVSVFLAGALTVYSSQVVAKPEDAPIGFNPLEDRIDFGDIPLGAGVGKTVVLENRGQSPTSVRVFVLGSIGELVEVEPSSFILEAADMQEVELSLIMPVSATVEKKYTGRIVILRLPRAIW